MVAYINSYNSKGIINKNVLFSNISAVPRGENLFEILKFHLSLCDVRPPRVKFFAQLFLFFWVVVVGLKLPKIHPTCLPRVPCLG